MNKIISLILKGMAMGIAEVIPGVSGGSIALITNIYERLLNAINNFNLSLYKVYKKEGIQSVMKQIDAFFLLRLMLGMGIGVLFGIFVISHLMDNNPELLWGFFFGLILASSVLIFQMIKQKTSMTWGLFILGTLIAYGVTMVTPYGGSSNLLYVFFCGTIAICALILPGISGSFILLLLGMYTVIIKGLKELIINYSFEKLLLISVFAVGCLVGLKVFSKVITWTYNKYKNNTLALMTGFMLGSLNKIWPWKIVSIILEKNTGTIISSDAHILIENNQENYKIISETNVFPNAVSDPHIFAVLGLCLVAIILIVLFQRLNKTAF